MSEIEFDMGLPVPPRRGKARRGGGKFSWLWDMPEDGSKFVPATEVKMNTLGATARVVTQRSDDKRKFVVRAVTENGVDGYRVFRPKVAVAAV